MGCTNSRIEPVFRVVLAIGCLQLVGLAVPYVSASDALCAEIEKLEDVAPGSGATISGRVYRCDDRSAVGDVTIHFSVERQCRSFDPSTASVGTTGEDSHLDLRPAQGAILDAFFILPAPCAKGITELVATVVVEKQGFEPSDPVVVLKQRYRPDTPCNQLYADLDEAYREYISTYEELIRAVAVTPIEGPPHLVELQRAYFATKLEEDPRRAYQEGVAAVNKLNSQVSKIPIDEPIHLWWHSNRYHQAKHCYEAMLRSK